MKHGLRLGGCGFRPPGLQGGKTSHEETLMFDDGSGKYGVLTLLSEVRGEGW
jgi:hypothetical protein